MAYQKNEKSLNADIKRETFLAFDKQRKERSQVKKDAVDAALQLWTSLPAEIQVNLISQNNPNETVKQEAQKIIKEEVSTVIHIVIDELYKALSTSSSKVLIRGLLGANDHQEDKLADIWCAVENLDVPEESKKEILEKISDAINTKNIVQNTVEAAKKDDAEKTKKHIRPKSA